MEIVPEIERIVHFVREARAEAAERHHRFRAAIDPHAEMRAHALSGVRQNRAEPKTFLLRDRMLMQKELCRGEMKDTRRHSLFLPVYEKNGTPPEGASRLFPKNYLRPYFLLNLSTRPLVSTSFCLPV